MLKKTLKLLGCVILTFTLAITSSVSSFAHGVVVLVSPDSTDYLIMKGDTLASIAQENNISTEALAAVNGISNPNRIYANQRLALPGSVAFSENSGRLIRGIEEASASSIDLSLESPGAKGSISLSLAKENLHEIKSEIAKSQFSLKLELVDSRLKNETPGKIVITDSNGNKKVNFDSDYYAEENPDVVNAVGTSPEDLYEHFCYYGFWETRQPNEYFDVNVYYSAYPDLQEKFKDLSPDARILALYNHYVTFGSSPEENRYITNEEEAKKAGITIVSARDGEPVSQPPAAAPSVLYTIDRWWEDYFAYSMSLAYQFIEENHLPNEAKIMLDAKTPENFNTSDFRQYLSRNYPTLLDSFQSLETQTMGLIYRIGDTVEGQKYLSFRTAHPVLSFEDYRHTFSLLEENYFTYDGQYDDVSRKIGAYLNGRTLEEYVNAAHEEWLNSEVENPGRFTMQEPQEDNYAPYDSFDSAKNAYELALFSYLGRAEAYRDWVDSEPTADRYFIANYPDESSALSAKEEWEAIVPDEADYAAYKSETEDSWGDYMHSLEGGMTYEACVFIFERWIGILFSHD